MLESLFVTLTLCQQPPQDARPEFSPNPPRKVERQERPRMTLDIFVEMIRRGDSRADVNKDGKIDGKDLEIVIDRRMERVRGVESRPQPRRGQGNRNRGARGCSCKNK